VAILVITCLCSREACSIRDILHLIHFLPIYIDIPTYNSAGATTTTRTDSATSTHVQLTTIPTRQVASFTEQMAIPTDQTLEAVTEDNTLGSSTLANSSNHLAKFAPVTENPSNGIAKKRKAAVADEKGDQELATIPKRKRSNEPEVSRAPVVLSRSMQIKLNHSKRQQAFYRSGVKARPKQNLRNAVLDKIAELKEVIRKAKLKEIEKTNKLERGKDECPQLSTPVERQNKDDETVKTV